MEVIILSPTSNVYWVEAQGSLLPPTRGLRGWGQRTEVTKYRAALGCPGQEALHQGLVVMGTG